MRMERSIKNCYLRSGGHKLNARLHSCDCGRSVERVDRNDGLKVLDNALRDNRGFLELLTAVSYSVTYCVDLVDRGHNSVLCGCEEGEHLFECYAVIRKVELLGVGIFACGLMCDGAARTDSLAKALCDDLFAFHIEKLIFQR